MDKNKLDQLQREQAYADGYEAGYIQGYRVCLQDIRRYMPAAIDALETKLRKLKSASDDKSDEADES